MIFVIVLGIILIAMVAAPMAVWDKMSRRSCEELIDDEQEYAPFAFDPSQGEEGGRETQGLINALFEHVHYPCSCYSLCHLTE